jgi:hypothetical protein
VNDLENNPQVSIPPEEDARLPILEAEIETIWRQHAPSLIENLERSGELQRVLRDRARQCVIVLHQCQNAGLNPDQGREATWPLTEPRQRRSKERQPGAFATIP